MVFAMVVFACLLWHASSTPLLKTGLVACGEGSGDTLLLDVTSPDFNQATVLGLQTSCFEQEAVSTESDVILAQVTSTSIKGFGVTINPTLLVTCSSTNLAYGMMVFLPGIYDNAPAASYVALCLNPAAFQTADLAASVFCLHNTPGDCWATGTTYSMYRVDSVVGGAGTSDGTTVSISTPEGPTSLPSDPYSWTNAFQITSFLQFDGTCDKCPGDYAQSDETVNTAIASYFPPHYMALGSLDSAIVMHSSSLATPDIPCSSFPSPFDTAIGQNYFCGLMLGAGLSTSILSCGSSTTSSPSALQGLEGPGYGPRDWRPSQIRYRFGGLRTEMTDHCGFPWVFVNQTQTLAWTNSTSGLPQFTSNSTVDPTGQTYVAEWFTLHRDSYASYNLTAPVVGGGRYYMEWSHYINVDVTADYYLTVLSPNGTVAAYSKKQCNATGIPTGKICRLGISFYSPVSHTGDYIFMWREVGTTTGVPSPYLGTFSLLPEYSETCYWDNVIGKNSTGSDLAPRNRTVGMIRNPKSHRRSVALDAVGLALPGVGSILFNSIQAKAEKKIVRAINQEAILVKTSLATLDYFNQYALHSSITKPLLVSFQDNIEDITLFATLSKLDSDLLFSIAGSWVVGQIVQLNSTYYQVATAPPLIALEPVQVCPSYGNGTKVGPAGSDGIATCEEDDTSSTTGPCVSAVCTDGVAVVSTTCSTFHTNLDDQAIVADIEEGQAVANFTGTLLRSISDIATNLSISLGDFIGLPSFNSFIKGIANDLDDLTSPFSLSGLKGFGNILLYLAIICVCFFLGYTAYKVVTQTTSRVTPTYASTRANPGA